MKKLGSILSLTILMILLSCSPAFAAGLELTDSYPKDGSHDSMLENVVVKLYFNEDVSAKQVQEANKDCFVFTDEKGKEIPLRILYPKEEKQIWVLVEKTLQSDAAYKLEITGNLQIPNGDTLGQNQTVEFRTRNTSMDTTVNMGLMFVMVIGMLVFSSISMKRNLKKQEAEKEDQKVNPYKVAKETGKSVEDIVAKTEKQKAKADAAKKKKSNSSSSVNKTDAEAQTPEKDTKRVKNVKKISEAGSTYITGRKEAAEKAAAKAAERAKSTTTNPKNATGKSKNKGKKK